jgi:DNA end-binding protein Ku
MATSSKRILWKGAISFGLVHIPIALHSATEDQSLDFDWLDKRSMDPVGYKRINKKTGKDITAENIVKGIAVGEGNYVVLSAEEISSAYPKTTQTLEIESFVDSGSISSLYFDRPYFIAPINKADKVYALLREVLKKAGKVGIAKVVIQTKQHLAMLSPSGPALVLNLVRWGSEIRTWDDLNLPADGVEKAGLTAREMQMGAQLVEDMSAEWAPDTFTDSFRDQIMELVDAKVKAGDTAAVTIMEPVENAGAGATVYDLTELLKRSLKGGARNATTTATPSARTDAAKVSKPRAVKAVADAPARESNAAKAPAKMPVKTDAKATAKATATATEKAVAKAPAKKAAASALAPAGRKSAARAKAA